jgi:predicted aspartyl protease
MARLVKLLFALLVALIFLPGCAGKLVLEEDGALAVIPHRVNASGQIVVEAMLNSQGPFRFALDTGASISVVFERARKKAGIEPARGQTVNVLGMTGSGNFPIARVARLSVGSESWQNARVALLPDSGPIAKQIDGILGLDFLSRYAVWYSQQERVLRLYPRELVAERHYAGWTSIPLYELEVAGGDVKMFAFDTVIDTERIPTMFDLGATVNLMNRRAARELGVPTVRPRDSRDVWGAIGHTADYTELIVMRLKIGTKLWRNRVFLVGDFAIFDVLDIGRRPLAIAGTSFFKKRDFIIDFARMRLLVRIAS